MAHSAYTFTLEPEIRAAYKEAMRDLMIAAARQRHTITYSDLAGSNPVAYLHPHSFTFTNLLREVCREEYAKGHGQLCALVVSKITGMPSGGYFRGMADEHDTDLPLETRWQRDLDEVFRFWAENG